MDFEELLNSDGVFGMNMFDKALSLIGPEPKPISNEEYRSRQSKLFSQFGGNELLILCSSPETIRIFERCSPPISLTKRHDLLTGWYEPDS